jgi:phage replication O-like protein O
VDSGGDRNSNSNYTYISNDVINGLLKADLNGTQYRIIYIVLRFADGYQRKNHPMSLKFISDNTGINKSHVSSELKKLIERKFIIVTKKAKSNSPRILRFNTNVSQWKMSRIKDGG